MYAVQATSAANYIRYLPGPQWHNTCRYDGCCCYCCFVFFLLLLLLRKTIGYLVAEATRGVGSNGQNIIIIFISHMSNNVNNTKLMSKLPPPQRKKYACLLQPRNCAYR